MEFDIDLSQFKNSAQADEHLGALMGYDGWDKHKLNEWVQLATSIDAGAVAHLRSDSPEHFILRLRNADTAKTSVLRTFIRTMQRINREARATTGHTLLALSIE